MKLIILDPGLESASGHHMAMLESFYQHNAKSNDLEKIDVDVYCHKGFSIKQADINYSKNGVNIHPRFDTEFYQHFNQDVEYSGVNQYVLTLANEYYQLLSELSLNKNSNNILLHTLLWGHALALNLALTRFKASAATRADHEHKFNIVVLLMFNPKGFQAFSRSNIELNFNMAFKGLAAHNEIEFYTGDQETLTVYTDLFALRVGKQEQPGLHPCFFINQIEAAKTTSAQYIVGYLGDAKKEKGFLALPALIDEFCHSQPKQTLLIHYTLLSLCPKLKAVEQTIIEKARLLNRVKVLSGYLESEKLHRYLANSSLMLLSYDKEIYANKTSGLLWLAAYHSLPVICPKATWLWREASRLNLPCSDSYKFNNIQQKQATEESPYRKEIFFPFVKWLKTKYQ